MPTKAQMAKMTAAELDDLIQSLNGQRDKIKDEIRDIAMVRDERYAQEAAAAKVAAMTDTEREAVRAALNG